MLKTVRELIQDMQENYDENELITGTIYSISDMNHEYANEVEAELAWSHIAERLSRYIEVLQEEINMHLAELVGEKNV